ncbi:MAG: hypothetical protein ACUVQ0_04600 [Thermoproteota archaeon]
MIMAYDIKDKLNTFPNKFLAFLNRLTGGASLSEVKSELMSSVAPSLTPTLTPTPEITPPLFLEIYHSQRYIYTEGNLSHSEAVKINIPPKILHFE